jgi:predicted CoA-binding protein
MKKTLVLGASTNPSRASNAAVYRLLASGHEPIPVGIREGKIAGVPILQGKPPLEDIHTITLYLNAKRQEEYYDYILSLNPIRIIFNPGTENAELARLAREQGIEVEAGCTLVMLTLNDY